MRVLIIGDSPHIKTGFGRVNSIAVKAFQKEGWQVACVAGLTTEPPADDNGVYTVVPSHSNDVLGVADIEPTIREWKPDIIYMTADLGSVVAMAYSTPEMPSFAYVPIEGSPIVHRDWKIVASQLPIMACSKYGTQVVREQFGREIDFAYHGVDHSVFNVNGRRDEWRQKMHWDDKFVITAVATNVRRKQLPRLIEAVSILKYKYKQKDIILYLHTVPYQQHWLEGWNLFDIVRMYQIDDITYFDPRLDKRGASVPETSDDPLRPGLVDMYNISDIYVNPSQVEGFSLPNAEAMACGVPVLTTKYAAGWEVVQPAGRGLPVHDWEVHKSGTLYANISPAALADEILRLKRNPKERQRMSDAGLVRARDFDWKVYESKLIPSMEQAIVTYQERHTSKKERDTSEETEGRDGDHLREVEDEGQIQKVRHLVERQSQDTHDETAQDGSLAP